ncbi:MAG: methyltransferase domain-containing protein [Deltaproteobacteria bacterium]|nr:methyltransferase domain-containing protein [Deltaproteobacteria bacterium]
MRTSADYLLPRTTGEARRLQLQSELLREATETLLGALDISESPSCIDIGCGTGDVMLLMAQKYGDRARIVGLDLDTGPATARFAAAASAPRFELVQRDLFSATPLPGAPFGLTFSRYLLHHAPDPVAALTRMWELTADGGTLAVLDLDQRGTTTYPLWPPYEQIESWIRALYVKTGIDNHIGHKLPHLFERAGIGKPDGTKVVGVIRTIAELAEFLPLLLDMIRGKLVDHAVATQHEIDRVGAELATAPQLTSTYCYRPTAVGVWKQKRA